MMVDLALKLSAVVVTAFLCVSCAAEGGLSPDVESRITSLEQTLAEQQTANSGQADSVAALAAQVEQNSAVLTQLSEEVAALSGGVDLTELEAQVAANTMLLETLEPKGLATEDWVEAQGFVSGGDLDGLENTVASHTSSIASNSSAIASSTALVASNTATIAQNSIAIAANGTTSSANAADVAANAVAVLANSADIVTNAADIVTNAGAVATNASAIATNASAIASNAADVATNAGHISSNSGDISSNSGDISSNAGSIAGNALDIANNAAEISVLGDGIGLFGSPALWETSSVGAEGSYNQGRSGLLLITSDGAFYISQQINSGIESGIRAYVTFYVNNPSSSSVAVNWNFCRSDTSTVSVDGANVASPGDGDGQCSNDVSFTLSPGSHVIQITDFDSNNFIEGVGVRNAWIAANGLEVDYAGLENATGSAL
tara:strand:+ start:1791 stop:3092 length:1302 start_codon:yes stop_codon:yes gene_type:complete